MNSKTSRAGFTLLEMMIVILIVGILAQLLNMAIPFLKGKVRDKRRIQEFSSLQRVIEIFRADTGLYPSTGGNYVVSEAPNLADFAIAPTVNSVVVPNVVPTYYEQMPQDPLPGPSDTPFCAPLAYNRAWAYISDGSHYKLVYHCASETNDYDPASFYYDPGRPNWAWAASDNMQYVTSVLGW